MNAGNLMAVSTADGTSVGAGAPKVRPVSAGNRAQTTSGKNSFSDTFGALQKGLNADAAKAQTRDGAVKSVKNTDVPEADINASSQDTQNVPAKTPKIVDEKPMQTKSPTSESADAAVLPNTAAAAFAALLNTDAALADTNEGLDAALADILERYELTAEQLGDTKLQTAVQNLLQQMPEEGQKSRNFLLALSGEPLVTEGATGDESLLQSAESGAVLRLTALDPASTAQLRAVLNTDTAPVVENIPAADVKVPAESVLQQAGVRQPLKVSAEAHAVIPEALAQAESMPAQGKSAAELVGENLITGETADGTNPLDVLAQRTMRHDNMQREAADEGTQQEQQPMQNGAQQTRSAAAPFETAARTWETAPQAAQPIAAQSGAGPAQTQEIISSEPVQEPQTRPQPDYEIPRQIVEQARLLRTLTDTQMVIRLKPEHLGELTLRVAVGSDGAVQASFHSDNAHVRNVIENSLVQLRQELSNQGIKVDRVGVYTGLADGQMPQGQGQGAWQQSGGSRRETQTYARGDADDYLDDIEGLAPVAAQEAGSAAGADGVDYRV